MEELAPLTWICGIVAPLFGTVFAFVYAIGCTASTAVHFYLPLILDFGYTSPGAPDLSAPDFLLLLANVSNSLRVYASSLGSAAVDSSLGHRCLPSDRTSTFFVCLDDASYARLVSVFQDVLALPMSQEMLVLLILWIMTVRALRETVFIV